MFSVGQEVRGNPVVINSDYPDICIGSETGGESV